MLNASQPGEGKVNGSSRPADECPWPRPFPRGFDQCPVFRAQRFSPTDMSDRPLPSVLTCGHLGTRPLLNGKVGWYAACKIGDDTARRKLAEVGFS
jgi:hypothetical protein